MNPLSELPTRAVSDQERHSPVAASPVQGIADYVQTLGSQAKAASALMARADTAIKNTALRKLASLLRASGPALQRENAKDIERATQAGLAAPLVDR
ncbi:MAG: gamma-glutamyl-phosphate reductase, partial [Rhodoferax sp.]